MSSRAPTFDYDIFISYSHIDNELPSIGSVNDHHRGWVDTFHTALEWRLKNEFGKKNPVRIWQDRRGLHGSDIFREEILRACQSSAILMCITSRSYMNSDWCAEGYKEFVGDGDLPRFGNISRIFNVKINKASSKSRRFNDTIGYEMYYSDPDYEPSVPLWPRKLDDQDGRYWRRIEQIARDVRRVLEFTPGKRLPTRESERQTRYIIEIDPGRAASGLDDPEDLVARLRERLDMPGVSLVRAVEHSTRLILEGPRSELRKAAGAVTAGGAPESENLRIRGFYPINLDEILLQAKDRLIVSGHTLNRFSHDRAVGEALEKLLTRGVRVSLLMLNPKSKYARAHAPHHEFESSDSAKGQYLRALKSLERFFGTSAVAQPLKSNLEVLLSNYMPRFRAIIVDDASVYLYNYMFAQDVSDYPDVVLSANKAKAPEIADDSSDSLLARVVESSDRLLRAPETVPYIRYGRIYKHWKKSRLARWDSWKQKARYRHAVTHDFYITNGRDFHQRFGRNLNEQYVKDHLEKLSGRCMVLGCGSGKEIEFLLERGACEEVYGVDFSPVAIELARERLQVVYGSRPGKDRKPLDEVLLVDDFYDLEHLVEGQFDCIVANAAFVHLCEVNDLSKMLGSIWEKLSPGGVCFMRGLYRERDGVPMPCHYHESKERFHDIRWFVYYSRKRLVELAESQGFSVDDSTTRDIALALKLDIASELRSRHVAWKKNSLSKYGAVEYSETPRFDLETIMKKGFYHRDFPDTFWPTILIGKSV